MMKRAGVKSSPFYFFFKEGDFIKNKYEKEQIHAIYYGDEYTIVNLTPMIHKDDRQEQKAEIEKALYTVFRKYVPKHNRLGGT